MAKRPLRAYIVTHDAITQVNNVVAARTIKEALERDRDHEYIEDGWTSNAFPTRKNPSARRFPEQDSLAARAEPAGEPR